MGRRKVQNPSPKTLAQRRHVLRLALLSQGVKMEDLPEELKLQYKGRPGPRKPPATCSKCGALISNAQGSASASSDCGDDARVADAVNILTALGQRGQAAPVLGVPESTESQDLQRSTSRKQVRWNPEVSVLVFGTQERPGTFQDEGMSEGHERSHLQDEDMSEGRVHKGPCYLTEFLQVSHTLLLICKVALTMNPTR